MEDSRQHNLEQRVTQLEGRLDSTERSIPKRLTMWVSLLALGTAISTGAFQLWDGLILRQQAEFEANRRELNGYVRRITELNSYIIGLQGKILELKNSGSHYNPAVGAEIRTLNLEKLSTVRMADRLIEQHKKVGNYPAFLILAQEHLAFGESALAFTYSQKAEEVSRSNAEATMAGSSMAIALFLPGKIQDTTAARKKFKTVLQLAKNLVYDLRLNIYRDWIIAEGNFGNCDVVEQIRNQMADDLKTFPNKKIYEFMQKEIEVMLEYSMRTC